MVFGRIGWADVRRYDDWEYTQSYLLTGTPLHRDRRWRLVWNGRGDNAHTRLLHGSLRRACQLTSLVPERTATVRHISIRRTVAAGMNLVVVIPEYSSVLIRHAAPAVTTFVHILIES